ncbi:hypothetical protein NDU88_001030 [Pleurodeles waltl]|uniref:Uncharacterized protein n=1 Tax=Pleurodeles waltl TaxID=8319 RepID=A0AAV7SYF7_PLEWA|nr:hypothetical protein NDU88_001030 [Pleurodeles waltl]
MASCGAHGENANANEKNTALFENVASISARRKHLQSLNKMMHARQDASRERKYFQKIIFFYLKNAGLCRILQPTVRSENVHSLLAQIRNEQKNFLNSTATEITHRRTADLSTTGIWSSDSKNATGSLQENEVEETEGSGAETELKKLGHDGKESLVGSGLVRHQCYEDVVMNG